MNKRAQLKISFGMMFSIILIIMFLSFGFYAISGFLGLQEQVQTEKFIDSFQEEVDTMWSNQVYGTKDLKFSVPSSVEKVCFVDRDNNFEIWDEDGFPDNRKINNIDIVKILDGAKSLCIKADHGKIIFEIEQLYGADNSIIIKEIKNE